MLRVWKFIHVLMKFLILIGGGDGERVESGKWSFCGSLIFIRLSEQSHTTQEMKTLNFLQRRRRWLIKIIMFLGWHGRCMLQGKKRFH